MPESLYRLTHGPLLLRLMRCPDTGGQRHTVRSLAAASGISKSKISHMIRGQRMKVTAEQARLAAAAVGMAREALFLPELSSFENDDSRKGGDR